MSWRQLAFLNWRVPAPLLAPFVPAGTELDLLDGHGYVSIVGFLYADVRVAGLPAPLPGEFPGLNVRFYARRVVNGETRRGVVFLREMTTLPALAIAPLRLLNEPFESRRMTHEHAFEPGRGGTVPRRVEYRWEEGAIWGRVAVEPSDKRLPPASGSEREFVTERYHSWTRQPDGGTLEYTVRHRTWEVWRAARWEATGDLDALTGAALGPALRGAPASAFLADGAPVTLHAPVRIA